MLAQRRLLSHVLEYGVAEAGQPRKEIPAVQRQAGPYPRIAFIDLLPEVHPFLEVRASGSELAAHRKPAAPGSAAEGHMNAFLGRHIETEERATLRDQGIDAGLSDAVTDDVEKAVFACRSIHQTRSRRTCRAAARCDIDHWEPDRGLTHRARIAASYRVDHAFRDPTSE